MCKPAGSDIRPNLDPCIKRIVGVEVPRIKRYRQVGQRLSCRVYTGDEEGSGLWFPGSVLNPNSNLKLLNIRVA